MRAIYREYEKSGQSPHAVLIADRMSVSKPAVSKMLKKLSERKLLKAQPYSKISLTAKGLKAAQNLTYKHRIIEVFLSDVLRVDKERVHDEAHVLEHAFSDTTIKKLAAFLNDPTVSPHGRKIPKPK